MLMVSPLANSSIMAWLRGGMMDRGGMASGSRGQAQYIDASRQIAAKPVNSLFRTRRTL